MLLEPRSDLGRIVLAALVGVEPSGVGASGSHCSLDCSLDEICIVRARDVEAERHACEHIEHGREIVPGAPKADEREVARPYEIRHVGAHFRENIRVGSRFPPFVEWLPGSLRASGGFQSILAHHPLSTLRVDAQSKSDAPVSIAGILLHHLLDSLSKLFVPFGELLSIVDGSAGDAELSG